MSLLDDITHATKDEVLKSAIAKLDNKEKSRLSTIMSKHINKSVNHYHDNAIAKYKDAIKERDEAKQAAHAVKRLERDMQFYEGYYHVIAQNKTRRGEASITNEYLEGVDEAIEYLAKRPTQITQHYTDPNPSTRVVQHRKSSGQ